MKIMPIIIFAIALGNGIVSAQQKPDSLAENGQEWATKQLSSFIAAHHVNANQKEALIQFKGALKKNCNMNCAVVLSVTGLELEAKRLSDTQAELQFTTYTEVNNKGFIIQKKLDNGSPDFDSIGFVLGKGNAATASSYTFKDQNSYTGYSFYRLKQVDYDGKSTFSKIVKVEGYVKPLAVQVFPNPVTNAAFQVKIFGFHELTNVQLFITDARGSRIVELTGLDIRSGSYTINAGKLVPGWYYLQAVSASERTSTTFIVR